MLKRLLKGKKGKKTFKKIKKTFKKGKKRNMPKSKKGEGAFILLKKVKCYKIC